MFQQQKDAEEEQQQKDVGGTPQCQSHLTAHVCTPQLLPGATKRGRASSSDAKESEKGVVCGGEEALVIMTQRRNAITAEQAVGWVVRRFEKGGAQPGSYYNFSNPKYSSKVLRSMKEVYDAINT